MFSLTTLETFIHSRWVGMLGADRAEIRSTLNTFLFQVRGGGKFGTQISLFSSSENSASGSRLETQPASE